jgi:hypothetical protein
MRWTLEQGLELIRLLQPETRKFNYHLTLGGGVLNTGASDKDLDLFFLPLDNHRDNPEPDKLLAFLRSLWGDEQDFRSRQVNGQTYVVRDGRLALYEPELTPQYEQPPNSPYKYKVKFMFGGQQRIDVFIIDRKRDQDQAEAILTETNACASSL